ncbi:MAG: nitroreductase family protein [Methanosarcinales archaeon]|nr:nitroreductase family protein [Methanosarcinales archaeon]
MDLKQALEGRRSVRRYQRRPLSREIITDLLQAAECAPSAGNLRARRYVVVTREEMRRALSLAAFGQSHIARAPALVVVCADPPRSSRRYGDRGGLYAVQDADAAIMCLILAAHDRGLGACWNGAFDDHLVRDILGLEEGVLPVAIISLGWPDESPPASSREGMEAVRWEVD